MASLQSQVTGLQHTAFTQQAQLERLNQDALAMGNASAQEQADTRQSTEGNLQHTEQHRSAPVAPHGFAWTVSAAFARRYTSWPSCLTACTCMSHYISHAVSKLHADLAGLIGPHHKPACCCAMKCAAQQEPCQGSNQDPAICMFGVLDYEMWCMVNVFLLARCGEQSKPLQTLCLPVPK